MSSRTEDDGPRGLERVKHAAIYLDGEAHAGRRHCDIIRDLAACGFKTPIGGEQGFVTDSGRFVTREDAARIALGAGQVTRERMHDPKGEVLYSEDLY